MAVLDRGGDELAGLVVEVQLFLMRFSASGRTFTRAYLNECEEVFLDRHVRAFDHFGGVPARIRYENLAASVCGFSRAATVSSRSDSWAMRWPHPTGKAVDGEGFACFPGPLV